MASTEAVRETTPSPAPISVWKRPYRTLTISLMLAITVAAFETLAVATILPAITTDLGGLDLYGWSFSAFLLSKLFATTLAGEEVDRQGPAWPFTIGVVVFAIGLLLAGGAPSMPILIVGRVIQGLGSGVIGSVAYVIIARGYPDSLRPRMLALTSTAWVVPGLIGPAIAGAIGQYIGWRWVFLGLVPLPIIAVLLSFRALQKLTPAMSRPRDWHRPWLAAQLAIGAAVLMIGFMQPLPWGVVIAAVGLLVVLPALLRLLPPGTLRAAPGLPAPIAVMGLLSMGFFGVDVFIPLAITHVRGLSTVMGGLALTAATITWTSGSWLLDRLSTRYSRRMFGLVGLSLILVGIALAIATLAPATPALLGIVAWAIAGLGIGLTYTTLSLVALELAPKGREGVSTSSLQVNDTLGTALGSGIGGSIIAAYGEQQLGAALTVQFSLMMLVIVIALLAALRLPAHGEREKM
jgi:MFS family permease